MCGKQQLEEEEKSSSSLNEFSSELEGKALSGLGMTLDEAGVRVQHRG